MSESSEEYSVAWTALATGEGAAKGVLALEERITAPSERVALAQRARDTARWHLFVAETLELRQP
jgi:hypothetical protein